MKATLLRLTACSCVTLALNACLWHEDVIVEAPPIEPPPMVSPEGWGSRPDPMPLARKHVPRQITIHHAGVTWKPDDDPFKKILGLQEWGRREKGWPDVPYHFLIAPDGRIFKGRNLAYEGETNTEYNTSGHALVQLWGNFEEQRVTTSQLRSAVHVAVWLCRNWNIKPTLIATHRDWSLLTVCPGEDLYRYFQDGSFRRWVREILDGETPDVRAQNR